MSNAKIIHIIELLDFKFCGGHYKTPIEKTKAVIPLIVIGRKNNQTRRKKEEKRIRREKSQDNNEST